MKVLSGGILRAVRLGWSLLESAGWRKATSLIALITVTAAILAAYASAEATKKDALDWYLGTAFPDYELTAQPLSSESGSQYLSGQVAQLIGNASNISGRLAGISEVASAQPYVPLMLSTLQGNDLTNVSVNAAAMFRTHEENFVRNLVQGSADLGSRQVLIPTSVASYLNLQAGMPAKLYTDFAFTSGACTNVTCPAQPAEVNITVAGIYEPSLGPPAGFGGIFPWALSRSNAPVVLNLSTLLSVLTNLTSLNVSAAQQSLLSNAYVRYDVLVNRQSLLDPMDAAGSTLRLARVRAGVTEIAIEFHLQISSPLETAYQHFLNDQRYLDLTVLVFASPVAIIGVYSGIFLGRTEALTRYRDFYIASARGASRRLLFASLGVEALFEAAIAGSVGAAVVWTAAQFAYDSLPLPVSALGPGVILAALLPTVLISLTSKAATVGRVRQGRMHRPLPGSRATEISEAQSSKAALGLFAVGVALLATVPFENAPLIDTTVTGAILFGTQRDWFVAFAVFAFIYGVVLLLVRPKGNARGRQGPSGGNPAVVYRRAAFRSGRWPEPALLVVASLALSMTILVSGLVALDNRSLASAVYGQTGGDILLVYPGSFPNQRPGANNPPIGALANVSGVQSITYSSSIRSPAGLSFVLFDTESYLGTIRPEMIEWGQDILIALSGSNQPGAAIANVAASKSYGLAVGAVFENLTIVGVLPYAPGVEDPSDIGTPTLLMNYRSAAVSPNSTDITRIVVRVVSAAQALEVQSSLLALDPRAIVENAPGELQVLLHSPVFSSLSTTASATVSASLAILVATFAGSLLASAAELQGDLVRMRTRGLTRRQGSRIAAGLILRGIFASIIAGGIIGVVGLFVFGWVTGHLVALAEVLPLLVMNLMAPVAAFYASLATVGIVSMSQRLTRLRLGAFYGME